jgi:hypothetical protein
MSWVDKFKDHWLIAGIIIIATCCGVTWTVCLETRVKPKEERIKLKDEKIADLEKKISELEKKLKILEAKQHDSKGDEGSSVPANKSIKKLEIMNIYYKAPGSAEKIKIFSDQTVKSGGKIWFEIKLPELGGYLLVHLTDSQGKMFNLFPGTKQAVKDGYYRVPYCLNNPRTEVQKAAADSTIDLGLPLDRILIGGYIFDKTKGDEIFHFYYRDKRDIRLETTIEKAIDTMHDMPLMKGILKRIERFDPRSFDRKVDKPMFYQNELKLKFEHE